MHHLRRLLGGVKEEINTIKLNNTRSLSPVAVGGRHGNAVCAKIVWLFGGTTAPRYFATASAARGAFARGIHVHR